VYHPYGLAGGEDASCGLNIWVRNVEASSPERSDKQLTNGNTSGTNHNISNGVTNGSASVTEPPVYEERRINLGGKNTASMQPGERIIICTPGGGGWGKASERESEAAPREKDPRHAWRGGSHASREDMALQA
jgi:5-oxoprolinase (ATP-hydrolysing)